MESHPTNVATRLQFDIERRKVSCESPLLTARPFRPTIIIPTRDRLEVLSQLLDSIKQLEEMERILPEVIVADNDSRDGTYDYVEAMVSCYPTIIRVIRVLRAGKSAAINEAVRVSTGNLLAFLDDDVVADKAWLTSVETYFQAGVYHAAQGTIRLRSPAGDDPEVQRLNQRYRTIPKVEYDSSVKEVRSLNGSNCFVRREAFERVGGFDERLGPGASGTSEDVELAMRLARAGIGIGYANKARVYHQVDRNRFTEEYFERRHWQQGRSRLLIRDQGPLQIRFNLARSYIQYGYYTWKGEERKRYRSKGRLYHYRGMLDAKRTNADCPRKP